MLDKIQQSFNNFFDPFIDECVEDVNRNVVKIEVEVFLEVFFPKSTRKRPMQKKLIMSALYYLTLLQQACLLQQPLPLRASPQLFLAADLPALLLERFF